MWWIIPAYLVCVAVVVWLSILIANYVDMLDKKTKVASALIGAVIFAGITSLPELFTSVWSVAVIGEPGLSMGNILGSNLFNLSILAIMMIFGRKAFASTRWGASQGVMIVCALLTTLLIFLNTQIQIGYVIPYININILSIVILGFYILAVKSAAVEKKPEVQFAEKVDNSKYTLKQTIWRFVLVAVALVAFSIALAYLADLLSETYGLNKGFAGALLLGVVTSMPEFVSSIQLIRLKNFDLALGNILGSNIFNFMIIVLSDALYFKGTVYMRDLATAYLSGFLIASLVLMLIVYIFRSKQNVQNKHSWPYILVALGLILCFFAGLALSSL